MAEKPSILVELFTRKAYFWIVLLTALIADIATKAWADTKIRPTEPDITPIIDGFIGWKWAENHGAAFSILDGRPILLAVIGSLVLAAVFAYVLKADAKRRWFLSALALVAGGAIGNLYDRMLLGHVRDFMFFIFDLPLHGTEIPILGWKIPVKYPVFNVADMEIIAGVSILVLMSFKSEPKKKAAETKPEAEPEPKSESQPQPEPEEVGHGA